MLQLFKSKNRSILGIDINPAFIKILELSKKDSKFIIENYGIEPLPESAMEASHIKDINVLAKSIQSFLHKLKIKTKRAVLAVPDTVVITKVVQVKASFSGKALEELMIIEAESYLSYPIEAISMDFKILGNSTKVSDSLDILLVAARADFVNQRLKAALKAGLHVEAIEVEFFAIERVISLFIKELPGQGTNQYIAFIDTNFHFLNVYIFYNLKFVYSRREVFVNNEQIFPHIKRVLQFFCTSNPDSIIDHIFLDGSYKELALLAKEITTKVNIATTLINAEHHINFSTTFVKGLSLSSLIIAYGLALGSI